MSTISSRDIQRLLDEAPFVRSLARGLVAHDVDDVVQNTWVRAIESDAATVRRPRRWLGSVVRSVAQNLRRGQSRRHTHEQAAAHDDLVPSSSELMEREERRGELVQAVDALPGSLRAVVLLRYFEDLPPRTIAERLGLPVTTVWNRLRTALATLRQRLDDQHGDRRAWLLPLLPAQAATAALATGILAMSIKTKVVAAVAVLALAVLALWTLGGPPVAPPPGPGGPGHPPPLTAEAPSAQEAPEAKAERTEVVTPASAAEPTTGMLIVKAIYGEDGTPVPDLVVLVGRPGADRRFGRHRVRTNEQGIARFEDLAQGRFTVANARNNSYARADVVAGADTEVELVLPTGVLVTGIVIDQFGLPVPAADVYLAGLGALQDAELVTTTGADGRFTLRSCERECYVGARASGHSPSVWELVFLQEGGSRDLRVELPAAGGTVEGVVLGPDRAPVVDAVVVIGTGIPFRIDTTPEGAVRALAHTGPGGRFRAVGVATGQHPVQVRAARMAPWTGSCRVEANSVTSLDVTLGLGMSCTGVVVDASGSAVPEAVVRVGTWEDFAHYRTHSAEDGTFRLDGLPPGEVEIRARHDTGRTSVTVGGEPGETVSCELRLHSGFELRGRVLTQNDEPVARASVSAWVRGTTGELPWSGKADSDARGRFAISNCPEDKLLTVTTVARGFRRFGTEGIDPRAGELVIRLDSAPPASVRIVGSIVAPDGQPVPQAMLQADGSHGDSSGVAAATDSGSFDLGPLVPGTWRVSIWAPGHPRLLTERRQLVADAVWDLGTIWLPASGTVRVRIRGADNLDPRLTVADSTFSHRAAVHGESDERRSDPVAAGSNYVSVSGPGVASQLVPVEVRAGEETKVEVQIEAGYRQRFQFVVPTPLSERRVRILRGDEVVVDSTYRARTDWAIPMEWERWLAPGECTITATGDGLSGQARFTVREGTDEVVRVVMQ